MSARFTFRNSIAAMLAAPALVGAGTAYAACTGLGAPADTETKCLTAVQIPGSPLLSYDISWVNPHRAEYYLGDRSNSGIDIIDTRTLTFKRRLGGPGVFRGVVLRANGTVNNDKSGPDGVASHGRWLYAGDGDSTLKVFDLDAPTASALKETVPSGVPADNRLDEMALTTDGEFLLTVNNAAEPLPFATLFAANGDRNHSSVLALSRITIDDHLFPGSPAIEQPAWDPKTRRFYVSVPILGKPGGCGTATCDGGMMVIDPTAVTPGNFVLGAFDPATNTGVVPLTDCGPNGATVGPHDNLLLGCTLANNPTNRSTLVINATTKHFVHVGGLVGSDEVWFNKGDGRYYTGSNRNCKSATVCSDQAADQAAVLGVVDGETNFLIETIPQSSGSHSVAADSKRNLIFVPQNAAAGTGRDTTNVGAGICGGNNGCVGVYVHHVDHDRDDDDRDRGDHDH